MSALAIVAGLTGAGLLTFWGWGILGGGISRGPEPWPGFRDHELAFALPDCVLGVALLACAALDALHDPHSVTLAGPCAGGLMFLGLLDLAYLWRTWGLRATAMRVRTGVLATAALSLGLLVLAL